MVPDILVDAVIHQESRGNPNAVSPVGAKGLMQIMPATAKQPGFGVRPIAQEALFDPVENKRFGTEYLGAMLRRYDGDVEAALAAYNWGAGNADKWVKAGKPFNRLPKETRGYIRNISADVRRRMEGSGGADALAGQEDRPQFDPEKLKAVRDQMQQPQQQPAANGFDPEKFRAVREEMQRQQAPQVQREAPSEPQQPGFLDRAMDGMTGMINEFESGLNSVDPNAVKQQLPVGVIVQGPNGYMVEITGEDTAGLGDMDAMGRVPIESFSKEEFFRQLGPNGETLVFRKTPEVTEGSPVLSAGRVLGVGAVTSIPSGTGRAVQATGEAAQAAQAAKRLGVTPSLGAQAAPRTAAAMESSLVTGDLIRRDAGRMVDEMGGARETIAAAAGRGANRVDGGNALRSGAENFISVNIGPRAGRASVSAQLLSNVEKRIPVDTLIDASEAKKVLEGIVQQFPNLKNTAKDLGITQWQGWIDDIASAGGKLQWQEVRALRTQIGEAIGKINGPLQNRSTGQLRTLYGALSDDLRNAAQATGPEALAAWDRYNKHFRRTAEIRDNALDIILKSDNPEAVFDKFYALTQDKGLKANLAKLRQIKDTMPAETWGDVVSTVVRRMGQSGDDFSPAKFVTEWGKFAPEAREVLFAGKKVPTGLKSALDDLVMVAEKSRGAERLINHSRSGSVAVNSATGVGLLAAAQSGDVVTIALTGLGLAGLRGSAVLMTNPKFLRGLRQYIASGGSAGQAKRVMRIIADQPQLAAITANLPSGAPPPQSPVPQGP